MSPVTAWLCVMILYYPFPKEKNIQNEFTIYGFIFVEEETYNFFFITKLIAQFTVTGGNEVKVELVLKQPFLFWYVYYFVLILTSIFKQNLHLKKMEFCIKTRSTSAVS